MGQSQSQPSPSRMAPLIDFRILDISQDPPVILSHLAHHDRMSERVPVANHPALEAPPPPYIAHAQPSPIYPGAFPVNPQLVPGAVAAPQLREHTGPLPRSFTRRGNRITFSPRQAFPRISERTIEDIQSLRFGPERLFKLDTRRARPTAYKTPDSVLVPLEKFFLILTPAVPSESDTRSLFQIAAMQYVAFLTEISAGYRWTAVYRYHLDFFNSRLARSRAGDWASWGIPDVGFARRWLTPERKLSQRGTMEANRAQKNRNAREGHEDRLPRPKACASCVG